MFLRRSALAAATAIFTLATGVSTASAQIYYWRDASGAFVLSDKPKDPSAKTYSVSKAAGIRTTKPLSARASLYQDMIAEQSDLHGVDANLVHAVIQAESAYDPRAVSVKGAMGLMQLMPETAEKYGVLNAFNPAQNIRAGVAYLKSLLVKYNENVALALAAYNAGPGAVKKYGGTVPPYRETRKYVEKITDAVEAAPPPKPVIYRSIEIVNGRPVTRYTTTPVAGADPVKISGR
jgi:soluble lytic murein transglycosylase-like protein